MRVVPATAKPLIAVLDGSVATTGALNAVILGAELLATDAHTLLILPAGSSVSQADLPDGIDLTFIALPTLRRSVGSLLAYLPATLASARQLKRLLVERQIQSLQVNDFYLLPGFLVRAFGWTGRIVGFVRIDPRRFGLPGRLWLAAARRWSDHLIAVSRFIAEAVPGAPRLTVLLNPSDVDPGDLKHGPRAERLVFISNYIRGKGQDTAIRAFHRIATDFPHAELHFHGGDLGLAKNRDYRLELEHLAATGVGTERIHFHDFAADAPAILAEARAALVLSHSESFSLTCQEASAWGVPVIATRCGGPEEIVEDAVTGYLVPVKDEVAAADRMIRLLADPGLAEAMGRRGAALMQERFSPERWRLDVRRLFGLPDPPLPRID